MGGYGNADGYVPSKYAGTFTGVPIGQALFMKPSDVLAQMLTNAQRDHRECLEKASKSGADPVDACALTWGEVHQKWREFAAWRPTFETEERLATHRKFWSNPKNIAKDNMARAIAGAD